MIKSIFQSLSNIFDSNRKSFEDRAIGILIPDTFMIKIMLHHIYAINILLNHIRSAAYILQYRIYSSSNSAVAYNVTEYDD